MTRTTVHRGQENRKEKIVADVYHEYPDEAQHTMVISQPGQVSYKRVEVEEGDPIDVHLNGYPTDQTEDGNKYIIRVNGEEVERGLLGEKSTQPVSIQQGHFRWGVNPGQPIQIDIHGENIND